MPPKVPPKRTSIQPSKNPSAKFSKATVVPTPSITTKHGTLRYKEASKQVRAIERLNTIKTATCHLGVSEAIQNQTKHGLKPAVLEIKAPEISTQSRAKSSLPQRREKCPALSVSTITSTNTETFARQRAWQDAACQDLTVIPSSSTVTPPPKGYGSFSSQSNYQGWIERLSMCEKSGSTTSSSGAAVSPVESVEGVEQKPKMDLPSSQRLDDTQHAPTQVPKLRKVVGPPAKRPCPASVIAGAPKPYIGKCPLTIEQIAKMSKARQKFFLTQDPRRTHCLVNPDALRTKGYSKQKEFNAFNRMVKTAENVCKSEEVKTAEPIICEIMDPENPLNLDFQGMDYKNTYEGDEQDFQNVRMYRRLCRHIDRRRVKVQTKELVEEELQNERLAIPERFAVKDRLEQVVEESEESVQFGKLYRSTDKPQNMKRIMEERDKRRARYKDLYLSEKHRKTEAEKKQAAEAEAAKEILGATVALRNFDEAVEKLDAQIKYTVEGEHTIKREEVKRRHFPHTIRETRTYKKQLKQENRVKRDKALVKQQFYRERTGKEKDYREAHLEISSDLQESDEQTVKTQSSSSDDEDEMQVGKEGDRFMLRGFHFKLGNNLRGKLHQRERGTTARKVKGCMTRDEWLNELAPKRRQVKLDVEIGIQKFVSPDDPNMDLFPPTRGVIVPKTKISPVKEFVKRRLGRHYERLLRSKLKIVMPRLPYHVKKFNLIRFLYSDNDRRLEAMRAEELDKDLTAAVAPLISTMEYINEQDKQRQKKKELEKRERMELLGIPCIEEAKTQEEAQCEGYESESGSDWVPEREPDVVGNLAEYEERMAAGRTNQKVPMSMVGNMPAPECRETTLRQHPRHPRDYRRLRVPSGMFHHAVQSSGLPHMRKLDPDVQHYENVRLPKRPYTKVFEARHHHDHWNPIQTNAVDVQYQAKVVTADITKEPLSKKEKIALKQSFEKANPACKEYVDQDLTTIKYDMEAMIAQFREDKKKKGIGRSKELVEDLCEQREFVHHSRPAGELDDVDYPGRQQYLDFLNEIRTTLEERKKAEEEEEDQHLCIDKSAYIAELEADLKSIESCLTSLSSSECTNLTNDSGSYLLMEGTTKVPLDYIRKSLVPFEELQRSRFKAVPIDFDAEDANPFKTMPFSGQKHAMTISRDTFFTFTTRLRNGLRLRLETPIVNVPQTMIGRGANKYLGAVTTDIDENYVTELKNRPSVKYFNFKSGRDFIKNGLRLKFESMVIQGQIVRAKIYDRLNEVNWQAMQKTKMLYEKLFAKWEKHEYEAAMSVVYKVKSFYEITDALRAEFRELDRQLTVLNMDIVFIEGIWIRRVMLQNFHYLLGDREWRFENDWIHRKSITPENTTSGAEEGQNEDLKNSSGSSAATNKYELEGFAESIANRSKVNVRNREKDDAWAIKAYYEDVYLPNKHPILIVFPDAASFLNGIENLKTKTFMLLLELHFTMAVHTELQGRLETFEEWCMQELRDKEDYVLRKCSKKYFMEDRAEELKRRTLDFMEEPIEESYNDPNFNHDRAVIAEVWRQIVPATQRGAGNVDIEPCDMVAMMSDVVVNLVSAFEAIPMAECREIEASLRRRRAYMRKLSYNAYQTEIRIGMEMKKVIRNLEPPYQKPKRAGKLKRQFLKKKVIPIVVPEVHISEHTKFFFRAFHDEGDVMQMGDARDSIMDVNNMQEQIVPFYFDHFLKLNGYNANYNFKTVVEQRDGPEVERLAVRSLVPDVMEKLEKWENYRKKAMEDNIARNPKMYENVNF